MTLMARGSSHAKPISWPPSEYWDGADGDWSSFSLRVGKPEQVVRVLPSTAGEAVLVVSPLGCLPGAPGTSTPTTCAQSRGELFNASESTSWNNLSDYTLGLEMNLGYNHSAAYGLDNVALGLSNVTGRPDLESQVVGAFATDAFYIGMFGLGQQPTNFSSFNTSYPSFLTTLKTKNIIPSLSWAYTAGATYRSKGVFGSLTFGGYDASRFVPNNVSFSLAQDISRDLVVGLQSITATYANGTVTAFLPAPILTFIDSTIPDIYLPLDVCELFEAEFGLAWNATYQTYLVDDDVHENLLALNPNITLQLGNSETGGATVDIILPYASFDLVLESPLIPGSRRYFPLARASNASQYTLGRTVLQEAYIVTNYEQSNFSIYQSKFEDGVKSDLVAIPAAGAKAETRHISRAIRIGVSLGITIFALLSLLVIIIAWRKWGCCHKTRNGRLRRETSRSAKLTEQSELSEQSRVFAVQEIDENSLIGIYRELPDSGKAELQDETTPSGSGQNISEMSQDRSGSSHEASESSSSGILAPHAFPAYELMACRNSDRTSPVEGSSAEDRLAIYISTNLSRKSWATNGTSEQRDMPCVKTTICAPKSPKVDLNRSLPPTPISESLQVSPIEANFYKSIATRRGFEAVLKEANFEPYAVGSIGQITPRHHSGEILIRRAQSQWSDSSMEMEIPVPPELPEAEVIRPLNVYRRDKRRCRNFF